MQNKKQLAVPMHPLLQYGLGDVFRTMYRKNGWFGKLKDASGDYDITVLLCSHNQYTGQVFKFFDYLNVLNVPWPHRTPNFRTVARQNGLRFIKQEDFGGYTFKDVSMELGPQEQKQYDKITKKPVIVIHPFPNGQGSFVCDDCSDHCCNMGPWNYRIVRIQNFNTYRNHSTSYYCNRGRKFNFSIEQIPQRISRTRKQGQGSLPNDLTNW